MHLLRIIFIMLIVLTMSSCLTYQTIEYAINFAENFNKGEITITYTDIQSTEKDTTKQHDDFEELIKMYQGDEFLLDQINFGIYVKERKLFEENGTLNARITGVFAKLGIDDDELRVKGDERYILLDVEHGDKIETDGKLFRSKDKAFVTWPKEQRKIYLKLKKEINEPLFSITPLFQDWLNK
jgi:hypothetical protein